MAHQIYSPMRQEKTFSFQCPPVSLRLMRQNLMIFGVQRSPALATCADNPVVYANRPAVQEIQHARQAVVRSTVGMLLYPVARTGETILAPPSRARLPTSSRQSRALPEKETNTTRDCDLSC